MSAPPVAWSEERQREVAGSLVGTWAADVWQFPNSRPGYRYLNLRFSCLSAGVNAELKYAVWVKLDRHDWNVMSTGVIDAVHRVCAWLNEVASATLSLLCQDLAAWEASLRSHLVATGRYRQQPVRRLVASQEYKTHLAEDPRIRCFRTLYGVVVEAYADGRVSAWEADVWDMRALNFRLSESVRDRHLDFLRVQQPWLRELAKQFLRYRAARYSGADCQTKLSALGVLSDFLAIDAAQGHLVRSLADVRREVVVRFVAYVVGRYTRVPQRNRQVQVLRVFLKACAYELRLPGAPKEVLIFPADYGKEPQRLVEEIPSEVLAQMKAHLGDLPVPMLQMMVVNLACGMRVSELCTLGVECLSQDSKGQWTLFCYQGKSKREHAMPVIDVDVVATIQAQQDRVRARFGPGARYLFPDPAHPGRSVGRKQFAEAVNRWIVDQAISTAAGRLYRFRSHALRHTVAMGWLRDGVSLHIIKRLLGHESVRTSERYAYRYQWEAREALERVRRSEVTIDASWQPVPADPRVDDPDVELLHRGLNSAVLPIGGCGRPRVQGPCEHVNRCLSCRLWRTSSYDLPQLEVVARRNRLLLPMARVANPRLCAAIERDLPLLEHRIARHRELDAAPATSVEDERASLCRQLEEAEAALDEARTHGLWLAVQVCRESVTYLRGELALAAQRKAECDEREP